MTDVVRRQRVPVFAFLLSELLFRLLGGRFDDSELTRFWQYLDVELLQHDLWRSVWYLHAQPPGFNLLLGGLLKLGLGSAPVALLVALSSLLVLVVLSELLRELGARAWLTNTVLVLFALSPSYMLYAHIAFYPQLEALFCASAALLLLRAAKLSSARHFAGFCVLLVALSWLRSAYHLGFVVLSVALGAFLVARQGAARGKLVGAAALAILVAVLPYAKSAALFGIFSSSSWFGMNLAKVVQPFYPEDTLAAQQASGQLSRYAHLEPFSPLAHYAPLEPLPPRFAQVPALADADKQSGDANLNHLAFIDLSRAAMRDSLTMIRTHPEAYAHGIKLAVAAYLESNADCTGLEPLRPVLKPWRAVYERLLYGRIVLAGGEKPTVLYPLLALFVLAVPLLLAAALTRFRTLEPQLAICLAFMLGCIVYVGVVSTLGDLGENARFRYAVDPLYFAGGSWLLMQARRWLPARKALATSG